MVNQIEWEYADIKSKRDAQRVIIVNKQDPANFKYFKPLHRHQKKYRVKQSVRIGKLKKYHRRARYMMTLTVNPRNYYDDFTAHDGLKDSWNKIRKRLQRISPEVQGITATEPQKSGNPHMHIILWNIHIPKYKLLASKLYKISSGYVKIEPVRLGNKGAVSYLGKYIMKGTRSDFVLGCLTRWKARTLNVFGKELRLFLGPLIENTSTGEWELWDFVCSYDDCYHKMGEEMADIVYCEPEKGPPVLESPLLVP